MRSLRLTLVGVVIAASATVASAATPTNTAPKLRVSPASGHQRTSFTVHFTPPASSGVSNGVRRSYVLDVSGPAHARGCVKRASMSVGGSAGSPEGIRLNPRHLGGRWCVGPFGGRIVEYTQPVCGPRLACPMFIALQTVGRFDFRVKRR